MKRNSIVRGALALVAIVAAVPSLGSQTYQVIYNFGGPGERLLELAGGNPVSGLTLDGHGNIFGTTTTGGPTNYENCFPGCGTVFELSPNGHGGWSNQLIRGFQGYLVDGGSPSAPVIFDRLGNLYVITNCTFDCASNLGGNVVMLTPTPAGQWSEKVLHGFGDGCVNQFYPYGTGSPIQCSIALGSNGQLYGATVNGGQDFDGAVFNLGQISITHWRYLILYSFTGGADGDRPQGLVILDQSGDIYGTTGAGGAAVMGVVYRLTPNQGSQGWTQMVLYSFQGGISDGANPIAGVVMDGLGNIYGTTSQGGSANMGTVFMLTPQANGDYTETVLYSFQGGNDAATPNSTLTFDAAGNLYGTAGGGSFGQGTLFKLTPVGGGHWTESLVHTFTGGMDGGLPYGGVTIDESGNLFGTASVGGLFGQQGGVAFEITP
jgi:uncharacterized repeat protein (TIGR03803 family)